MNLEEEAVLLVVDGGVFVPPLQELNAVNQFNKIIINKIKWFKIR